MLIEIKVPQLSESVAEATLLAWHKKVGEAVKRDENLIDIETDKVVLELPAPADGVLAKIIKGDGGTVKAGEVIATLDTEGKAAASAAVPAKPAAPAAKPAPVASTASAMPSARKIAEEKGIDTGSIAGSGRGGRVTKGDVLGATSPPAPEAPAAAKPSLPQPSTPVSLEQILGNRPEQRVPMSRLRVRIGTRCSGRLPRICSRLTGVLGWGKEGFAAAGASGAGGLVAPSTSPFVTRPPRPLPAIEPVSMPFSSESFRAEGMAGAALAAGFAARAATGTAFACVAAGAAALAFPSVSRVAMTSPALTVPPS